MRSDLLLLLFASVVHCATPSVNDASLITTLLLKIGGNLGWFTSWHQGFQRILHGTGSRTPSLLVEKQLTVTKR